MSSPENTAVISDRRMASRLRSKGYGRMRGGVLVLAPEETLYLLEKGVIKGITPEEFLRMASTPEFDKRYAVYRDLRSRGIVLSAGSRFETQGDRIPRTVIPTHEREVFSIASIWEKMEEEILFSVVDDEGDVTHYRLTPVDLKGEGFDIPSGVEITVLSTLGMVRDPEVARDLLVGGFFGRRSGSGLTLSLLECAYLGSRGAVLHRRSRRISPEACVRRAALVDRMAHLKYEAYRILRERGLIPRTGFKFGTHFRVYDRVPEVKREGERTHAPYLVQVVPGHYTATWEEISRSVRLAHGVRKKMIFMQVPERFVMIEWVRP